MTTLLEGPFSKQLKEGTKKSHSMAENTTYVRQFLKGVVDHANYSQLVANFYFIYQAMETEVDKLKDDPYIGPLRLNGLARKDALIEDVKFFWGPDWKDKIYPTEATQQYVNRIHEVAKNNPMLLIAHHYTRYMGDLSGGVILGNIAKKALKLTDDGLAFYDFPEISDKKGFKTSYRSVLDDFIEVDQHQINEIIAEANFAFRLNMYMFEEIQGDAGKSFRELLVQAISDFCGEMIVSKRYR
tara:strand:+ start:1615 stop:2340 length:726 start_codon:yes stop_codon:yes gene_type:complete